MKDGKFMEAPQIQREQILAEAKVESQRHEDKASLNKDYICNLKSQIGSRDWDLRRTLEGYVEARRVQDRIQQELSEH